MVWWRKAFGMKVVALPRGKRRWPSDDFSATWSGARRERRKQQLPFDGRSDDEARIVASTCAA
jgi:hypothetical protein